MKMLKFGNKSALFEYFSARIFKNTIVLSEVNTFEFV